MSNSTLREALEALVRIHCDNEPDAFSLNDLRDALSKAKAALAADDAARGTMPPALSEAEVNHIVRTTPGPQGFQAALVRAGWDAAMTAVEASRAAAPQTSTRLPGDHPTVGAAMDLMDAAFAAAPQADDFGRECDDADKILAALGLDPEQCRTDGGSLRVAKIIADLQTPNAALSPLGEGPRREITVTVSVPADWEQRLDMQWVLEREIRADRWRWNWPAPQSVEPVAWHVCSVNSDGTLSLEHAAAWEKAAHEHINDAINDHDIAEAAGWVVRPVYAAPPTDAEPVARVIPNGATVRLEWASVRAAHNAKPGFLYAAAPQSIGRSRLTEAQIEFALNGNLEDPSDDESSGFYAGARWAEAFLAPPVAPTDAEWLLTQWRDAYAAFKGAFDTPQQRLRMKDEYSTDARRRLRDFDEALRAHIATRPQGDEWSDTARMLLMEVTAYLHPELPIAKAVAEHLPKYPAPPTKKEQP